MKSEHRHELKTNELAEWLMNLPQWVRENRNTVIYLAVVVIVVLGLTVYKYYYKDPAVQRSQAELTSLVNQVEQSKSNIVQSQAQGADSSYRLLQIAESLGSFAGSEKNDQMAALALIKQAQAIRMELHYRTEAPVEQDKISQLDRAQKIYESALSRVGNIGSLAGQAKFGIAVCLEDKNEFAAAKKIYSEISTSDLYKGTTVVEQAKQRLAGMDSLKNKITFQAAKQAGASEAVMPSIQMQQGTGTLNQ